MQKKICHWDYKLHLLMYLFVLLYRLSYVCSLWWMLVFVYDTFIQQIMEMSICWRFFLSSFSACLANSLAHSLSLWPVWDGIQRKSIIVSSTINSWTKCLLKSTRSLLFRMLFIVVLDWHIWYWYIVKHCKKFKKAHYFFANTIQKAVISAV